MLPRLLASFVVEARVAAIRLVGNAILLAVMWLPLAGCSTTRTLIDACRDGLCR